MYSKCTLFDDFCKKEVICVKDCRKLGHVVDMEFDECNGCIRKLIIAEKCGILGCFFGEEHEVPFCNIKQIGPDIILVDFRC